MWPLDSVYTEFANVSVEVEVSIQILVNQIHGHEYGAIVQPLWVTLMLVIVIVNIIAMW